MPKSHLYFHAGLLLSVSLPAMAAVGEYQMLGIKQAPQAVVLPIQVNDRGFALHMYETVQKINQLERLQDTPSAVSVYGWLTDEDQTILSASGNGGSRNIPARDVLARLKSQMNASQGIPAAAEAPGFQVIQTNGHSNLTFLQDIFEVFVLKGSSAGAGALLDLTNPTEDPYAHTVNEALRTRFRLSAMTSDLAPNPTELTSDDDGGNIEVTPEGRVYVGTTTSKSLRRSLQKLTGEAPLELPTNWLFVGHVDEYLAFLPAENACGTTLVHADPIEAINIVRQRKEVPLIPREDLEGEGVTVRDRQKYKKQFFNSLQYFTRPGSEKKAVLALEDFDLKKKVRPLSKTENLDVEFLGNLNAWTQIQKSLELLRQSSRCWQQPVGLPTLFYYRHGISGQPEFVQQEIASGYTAATPFLNLVSLRRHVIIPKERAEFFGPVVRDRLGRLLGAANRVHEIDASYYEEGAGSVHCATNVLRTRELWGP